MTNPDKLKRDLDELILIADHHRRVDKIAWWDWAHKVVVAARQRIDEFEKGERESDSAR